ncbi:MAG: hypothetical protein F6K65_00805 [Moorea sp. SIO3C2]|nr:hypothetical protein [Moorena sp. SIO3C2]
MGETTPVAHGGNPRVKALAPQDRNGALSVMASNPSPSRVAPLHRFRRAIAYIELRLYQFLALTLLHIINFISPSPHLPTLSTHPTRPLS